MAASGTVTVDGDELLGVDAPLQNIVVGLVLGGAVWIDTVYRRHVK